MALAIGAKLGHYEILGPLGAGGMGEVYRARDECLEREVAIKVLPADLASDDLRRRRFESEVRSVSSLNHPNIVTIYDVGLENGVPYMAMERVAGQTLRQILELGPLPLGSHLASLLPPGSALEPRKSCSVPGLGTRVEGERGVV